MKFKRLGELASIAAARGWVVLFFVAAFEVMIMISPFAAFFYSIFNPVFRWFDRYAATRWLTAFFLPHMILPPTLFLQIVRVTGSILFVAGLAVFLVCAGQIYIGKLLKAGVADKGLYRFIRHPQYLGLGICGVGMSILWPRFFVLASLSIMFVLYIFLAKSEEKRLKLRFGATYERYAQDTGRFFPRSVEKVFAFIGLRIPARPATALTPALIVLIVIGAGFAARDMTLRSLPFETRDNITLVPILPEDRGLSAGVLSGLFQAIGDGKIDEDPGKDYLGYVMPPDYIMQGMIADTGDDSHLFKHHHTVAMISDWVLHPFEHLRRPPSAHMAKMHGVDPAVARRHHCPLGLANDAMDCGACPYRRVILVEVDNGGGRRSSGSALLSLDSIRIPIESIDLNSRTGEIVNITRVGKATAWKDVPTPAI